MKIKRYLDSDMRKVLRRVREDQGPDAVILSNRRTDEGIELIAAIDYDESIFQQAIGSKPAAGEPRHTEAATAPSAEALRQLADAQAIADSAPERVAAATASITAVSEPLAKAVATVSKEVRGDVSEDHSKDFSEDTPREAGEQVKTPNAANIIGFAAQLAEAGTQPSAKVTAATEIPELHDAIEPAPSQPKSRILIDDETNSMRSEFLSMLGLVESQLAELVWQEKSRRSPLHAQMHRNLARIGIAADIADYIVDQLPGEAEARQVWRAPIQKLTEVLPVQQDDLLTRGGVACLIGPTGVGKTTTIAKLAAQYALMHGTDDLALICADSYRIGAKEHLAAFGQILGVRVHSPSESRSLGSLIESLGHKKLVLIDTDGLSQRDASLSARLADYGQYVDKVRFYLTLSAASQTSVLEESIRRFSELPLAGTIVSKIDEAGQLGSVMNALIHSDVPALWFCDGQGIPDDIRDAVNNKLWFINQAIRCMETSDPKVDDHIMAQRQVELRAAHA